MLHKKNNFLCTEDELKSLTAWGKNLLWSLMVQRRILLKRLLDGSKVNRLLLGWVLSFNILQALHRHLTSPMSLMLGRWVPMMLWAVLLTLLQSPPVLDRAHHMPTKLVKLYLDCLQTVCPVSGEGRPLSLSLSLQTAGTSSYDVTCTRGVAWWLLMMTAFQIPSPRSSSLHSARSPR